MAVPPRILGGKTNLHPANTIPDDNVHRPLPGSADLYF